MNSTIEQKKHLDIRRFGKVLRYDITNAWATLSSNITVAAIVLALALIVKYYTTGIFSGTPTSELHNLIRGNTILSILTLASVIFPSLLYKTCNTANSGIPYGMLPASKLEKYLSMVVICAVFIPIAMFLIFLLVDAIPMLIAGHYTFPSFFTVEAVATIDLNSFMIDATDHLALWPPLNRVFYTLVCSIYFPVSFFIMTCTIFKRHKLTKSILSALACITVFGTAGVIVMAKYITKMIESGVDPNTIMEHIILHTFNNSIVAICLILGTLFLLTGWLVMRKTKY